MEDINAHLIWDYMPSTRGLFRGLCCCSLLLRRGLTTETEAQERQRPRRRGCQKKACERLDSGRRRSDISMAEKGERFVKGWGKSPIDPTLAMLEERGLGVSSCLRPCDRLEGSVR